MALTKEQQLVFERYVASNPNISFKQLLMAFWWEAFQMYKMNTLLAKLSDGMAWKFAYIMAKDAKKPKK